MALLQKKLACLTLGFPEADPEMGFIRIGLITEFYDKIRVGNRDSQRGGRRLRTKRGPSRTDNG